METVNLLTAEQAIEYFVLASLDSMDWARTQHQHAAIPQHLQRTTLTAILEADIKSMLVEWPIGIIIPVVEKLFYEHMRKDVNEMKDEMLWMLYHKISNVFSFKTKTLAQLHSMLWARCR